MISFRFHIVSIVAVFLGIAVGVVVGSTYVERGLVDRLEARIDDVSQNLDERRAENEQLEDDLGRVRDSVAASADYAVTARLADVPALVVALRGVDEDAVDRIASLARRAGAAVPGVLWVEDKWALAGEGETNELADLLNTVIRDPERLRERAWSGALEGLTVLTDPNDDGTAEDPGTVGGPLPFATTESLDVLIDNGYLALEPLDDEGGSTEAYASPDLRLTVVTSARAEDALETTLPGLVEPAVALDVPTVVADVHVDGDDAPERGAAARAAMGEELTTRVALVDHADLAEGAVAAIVALDAAADGVLGHYGYGPGADALLPRWSPP